jgi:hypothetical protein
MCQDAAQEIPEPPDDVGASLGDPHLRTSDQAQYDLQTHGEWTLVKAKDGGDGMEIQARTRPWRDSPTVAINVAIAARVAGDVVALYSDGRLTVNRFDMTYPKGKTYPFGPTRG